jgi:hypothetical protein
MTTSEEENNNPNNNNNANDDEGLVFPYFHCKTCDIMIKCANYMEAQQKGKIHQKNTDYKHDVEAFLIRQGVRQKTAW